MKRIIIIFLLLIFSQTSNSQNFVNCDLDGPNITGPSILPFGWAAVSDTDINCLANGTAMATPDLTNQFGPFATIIGIPYSGTTYVSGGLSRTNTSVWQEGIQQTVSGFCIGCRYNVNFFQTNIIKSGLADSSGCWSVYIDNTLAGKTFPTVGFINNIDLTLNWEFRSINFIATSSTHTIKFLPTDDDTSWTTGTVPRQSIRMGIDSIFLTQVIILPINLLSFSSTQKNNNVILNWTTSSEINNDFFTVEKSIDAVEWIDVIKKSGAGNSSSNKSYEAIDHNPYQGISYYRLKQTDYDGHFSYSKTEIVDSRNFSDVQIYPNPTIDYLIIEAKELINPRFTLYNMMEETQIHFTKNSNGYIFDTSNLTRGIYFLTIEQDGILLKKERIVIL